MHRVWVLSLVEELRAHMPHGMAKKEKSIDLFPSPLGKEQIEFYYNCSSVNPLTGLVTRDTYFPESRELMNVVFASFIYYWAWKELIFLKNVLLSISGGLPVLDFSVWRKRLSRLCRNWRTRKSCIVRLSPWIPRYQTLHCRQILYCLSTREFHEYLHTCNGHWNSTLDIRQQRTVSGNKWGEHCDRPSLLPLASPQAVVSGEKFRQNPEDCEMQRWSWESREQSSWSSQDRVRRWGACTKRGTRRSGFLMGVSWSSPQISVKHIRQ